ncbi:death-associated protein-like 1 homolog [Stigmatopora nigra]
MMVQPGSKSGTKDTRLLRAGHPPAVKAGSKRVAKKGSEEAYPHGTPEKETKRSDKARMQKVSLLLAGTIDKLSHDFPETPVSVRHSKMRPAVEKPHSPRLTFCIHQPRKF